jgi:8-oxo-dGTP pyrophosphatase MutT (NUDIX family)
MTATDPIARRAARVIVVDAVDRVLLLRGSDIRTPQNRYWLTVGGGLDPGEEPGAGAVRELFEETGLRLSAEELGDAVWHETVDFPFDGRWYRQQQDFFFVRVPAWEVDFSGMDADEHTVIDTYRWWTQDELRTTSETYYPEELPELLARLLRVEVR